MSELSANERLVLDNIIEAVSSRPDVWGGFSLADLPSIVPVVTAEGEITSAFVFFHPEPQAAGNALPIEGIEGLEDLHYVSEVSNVPTPEKFSFEIDEMIGGVPTYVFPADTDIPVWPHVFVHEAFHVFQIRFWDETDFEDQLAYDLSLENYEMALLEDQALIAAYQASDDESSNEAIRHFLALRATRLAEFPTVALDNQQEALEGAAEWFEWQHSGRSAVDDPWANPFSADLSTPRRFAQEYAGDYAGVAPLQRFYQSGATQLELLDRLGVEWQPQLESRSNPSELLAAAVEVDPADYESLIAAARQAYDPDGAFFDIAEIWLTAEPGEGTIEEDRSFLDAPPEVIACFAENGLTAEDLEADPTLLTPELSESCIAAYEAKVFQCIEDAGFVLEELDFDNLEPEAAACFG